MSFHSTNLLNKSLLGPDRLGVNRFKDLFTGGDIEPAQDNFNDPIGGLTSNAAPQDNNQFKNVFSTGGGAQSLTEGGAAKLDPTGITAAATFAKQFTKGKSGILGAFDDILLPSIDEYFTDPKDSLITVGSGGIGKAIAGLFNIF